MSNQQPEQVMPTYSFEELMDRIFLMDESGIEEMEWLIYDEYAYYPPSDFASIQLMIRQRMQELLAMKQQGY